MVLVTREAKAESVATLPNLMSEVTSLRFECMPIITGGTQ